MSKVAIIAMVAMMTISACMSVGLLFATAKIHYFLQLSPILPENVCFWVKNALFWV
jgi:hypothetical protein